MVTSATFSPDGRWVAAIGPKKIRLFDSGTGRLVREFGERRPKQAAVLQVLSRIPDGLSRADLLARAKVSSSAPLGELRREGWVRPVGVEVQRRPILWSRDRACDCDSDRQDCPRGGRWWLRACVDSPVQLLRLGGVPAVSRRWMIGSTSPGVE